MDCKTTKTHKICKRRRGKTVEYAKCIKYNLNKNDI